jgi:uncharacterized lipoprotein YmbA
MKTPIRAAALAALLTIAACNLPQPQADTARHFVLGGLPDVVPVADATNVRPVQVAGFLHNRSIAVRVAEHEVAYLDDARWAGPLDGAITQLLRARLSTVPGGATVSVQVQRCDLARYKGDMVEFAAAYTILPAEGDKGPARRGVFSAPPRKWDGRDYGALVGLMHDAVAELGDAIAAAVAETK